MEKITVFEAFAGYGSQSMALEKLKQDIGLDYEVVGISEIDPTAIKAYYAARDPELTSRGDTGFDLENVIRGGVSTTERTCRKVSQLWGYYTYKLGGSPGFQSFYLFISLHRHQQCRVAERTCRGVWNPFITSMGVRKGDRIETPQISLDGKRQGTRQRQIYARFQEMGKILGKPRLFKSLSGTERKRLWCAAEPRARLYGQYLRRSHILFPQTIQVRPPPQARIGNRRG